MAPEVGWRLGEGEVYLYLERKADVGVPEGEHIEGYDKSFRRRRYLVIYRWEDGGGRGQVGKWVEMEVRQVDHVWELEKIDK